MATPQNNIYTINNISIAPPPGSIMAYLSNTNPDGWVIADGVTRTDGATGKYNNLITMGIGTGTANAANYTPPDYRGYFIRGANKGTAGSASGNVPASYSNDVKNTQTDNLKDHSHRVGTYSVNDKAFVNDENWISVADSSNRAGTQMTEGAYIGGVAVANTETRPYNVAANWIIKL